MEDAESRELEATLADLLPQEEDAGADILAANIAPKPSKSLPRAMSADPSATPYPRGLVLDIALKTAPLPSLLEAYGISPEEFKELTQHPVFRHDMLEMRDRLKEEGFSFRMKAQAQAEQYLKQAWDLVHSVDTPANVKADLIKWTTKVANLEPKPSNQGDFTGAAMLPQLAEQLKAMPEGELELKVMQIVLRNAKTEAKPLGTTYESIGA